MAVIWDFPSDLEEKLAKIDALIDKQYIDQAICQLERYLEQPKLEKFFFPLRKKLVTCYLMKEEFEEADVVLKGLKQSPLNDHWVKAHDVLLSKWQGDETVMTQYGELLGMQSIHYQTLIEFVTQLQLFYISGWQQTKLMKLKQLEQATTLDVALSILSDIQQWEPSVLTQHIKMFEQLFQTLQDPLVKTSLFELLVNQGITCPAVFSHKAKQLQLNTTAQSLIPLEIFIQKGECYLPKEQPELAELVASYYRLFCLSVFPFFDDLDSEVAVLQLMKHLGIESEEKNDIIVSRLKNKPILSQTVFEVDTFILSLTK